MRDFVKTHQEYNHDSLISEKIQYDLLKEIHKINENPSQAEKYVLDLLKFQSEG